MHSIKWSLALLYLWMGFQFSADAKDPKLFHFAYAKGFLYDDPNEESTWEKTNASPTVANFNNYIYIGWQGLDNRVNLTMVGRTDYLDFSDSLVNVKKKITLDDSTAYPPALVVVDNRLILLYVKKGARLLEYLVIDTAGSIHYNTGSPIDLTPYVPQVAGVINGISAAKYDEGHFLGAITFKAVQSQNNELLALTFRLNNRDKLFIDNVFPLPEVSNYMPSVCYVEENVVGFGITTKSGAHPRFFAYHVDKDSIGVNFTNTDVSTLVAPFIYKKESEEDIHLMWVDNEDKSIFEASFTLEDVEFKAYKLTNEVNNIYSKHAPIIFPFNDFYYGIVWIGTDKQQFWLAKALAYNYESWMGDLLNDDLLLKEIVLPGSESSLMYSEEEKEDPTSMFITEYIDKKISQCSDCNSVFQHTGVAGQLRRGVRYFEADLFYGKNSLFDDLKLSDFILNVNVLEGIVYPGLCQGGDLEEAFEAIEEFLEEYEEEFVIFNLHNVIGNLTIAQTEELIEKFKDKIEFYTAKNGNNTYNDLFNMPIDEFRGKLIITTSSEELIEKYGFFYNIFNQLDDTYNIRPTYDIGVIDKMYRDQEAFIQKGAEYKRIDWHVNNTLLRALCNFKTWEECVEAYKDWKDLLYNGHFTWHLMFSTLGCGTEVVEFVHELSEVEEGGPLKALVFQVMGILAWLTDNAAYGAIEKTNREIPAYFQKWRENGTFRKDNRYNILFTEFSTPWMADIAIMDNVYFNTLDLVSPYNRIMDVKVNNRGESCDSNFNSSIEIEVMGENGPYTYEWAHSSSTEPLQSNLNEGFYEVKVTDNWGHSVVKRIELGANDDQFGGLSLQQTQITRLQQLHQNQIYAVDCKQLVANIKSGRAHKSWHDVTSVKLLFDEVQQKNHVARHFDIQSKGEGDALITLFFTKEDFEQYNQAEPQFRLPTTATDANINNIVILHQRGNSNTGMWGSYSGTTVTIIPEKKNVVWDEIRQRWEISFHVKEGGGFFLSSIEGNFDNQILQAQASGTGRFNTITWKAMERNVQTYFVEYSFDGERFLSLEKFSAKGLGNQEYLTVHPDVVLPPGQQVIFYRIRQVDKNFKTIYSEILPVNMSTIQTLLVHPNPAIHFLNITAQRNCRIQITDITSRKMLQTDIVIGKNEINIQSWAKGIYILSTEDGESQKVMVQ